MRFPSFCLQFEKLGKNFVWQKFDLQNQFHLAKQGYLEQVCDNFKCTQASGVKQSFLIRMKKVGAGIEIKKDLTRFEDPYYDFQKVNFPGLEITVDMFTPYCVFDRSLILLAIKPQVALANVKQQLKQQYFIVIDTKTMTAHEVSLPETSDIKLINKVFFCGPSSFLGQSKVSAVINEICEYSLTCSETNKWAIAKLSKNIMIQCKRITAFDYDPEEQALYLIRERRGEPQEEFDIFLINLKRNLNPKL